MEDEANFEVLKSKISFGTKYWLEFENKSIMGKGWEKLLQRIKINEDGSLTKAAKECLYSYKYAWNILRRIEKRTGHPVVVASKGGRGGGGWVKLNKWGAYLLETYNNYHKEIEKIRKRPINT